MNPIKKYIHRRKAAKIAWYLDKISAMPIEYRREKRPEISTLMWLHAYYEGRTASTPKFMLESQIILLTVSFDGQNKEALCRVVALLYNWVHKGEIRDF